MAKYNNIIKHIKDEISKDHIRFGQRMPTIRELSEKFQCSKVTVVRAYSELQKEHIVYSIPQSGYYLVEKKDKSEGEINKKIINFASGAPDENILPYQEFQHCLNQAIDMYKQSLFNYSDSKGLLTLIKVLANYFKEYQIFCDIDNIFITAGSQQAINILCKMPFPSGKKNILVEQPVYNGILKSTKVNNISVIGIERTFYGLDFNELEKKFANDNIKCFYTVSRFQNPLGISYSNEEKKRILKLAEKYDVYIIEDDYLGDLEIKNNSYPLYYYDINSRVIYIKSFSKILLPGLRIASVIVPKILINTFAEYKKWSDLGTSVLSQGALEIYIKSGMFKKHGKKIRNIYCEKMNVLKEIALSYDIPYIKWHIPDTGFFACIEILNNITSSKIINKIKDKNIYISDMKGNYLDKHFNNKILKISVSRASVQNIKYGIPIILDEILKAEKKQSYIYKI